MGKVRFVQKELIDIDETSYFRSMEDAEDELNRIRQEKEVIEGVTVEKSEFEVVEEDTPDVIVEYRRYTDDAWARDPAVNHPYDTVMDAMKALSDTIENSPEGREFRILRDGEPVLNFEIEGEVSE